MWRMNDYIISTDKSFLDFELIHGFISQESYWGLGRSQDLMKKAIDNSLYCFGVYQENNCLRKQVGFARVVSDLTVFGYVADLFILRDFRGRGLGKWLIKTIVDQPELRTLKKIILFTETPEFYTDFQFEIYDQTSKLKFMERKK